MSRTEAFSEKVLNCVRTYPPSSVLELPGSPASFQTQYLLDVCSGTKCVSYLGVFYIHVCSDIHPHRTVQPDSTAKQTLLSSLEFPFIGARDSVVVLPPSSSFILIDMLLTFVFCLPKLLDLFLGVCLSSCFYFSILNQNWNTVFKHQ